MQQLDSSAISSDLKRSDSQSSLLMPAKPVRGRKRSSSNVGQRCDHSPSHSQI